MAKKIFIEGMTCDHCVNHVRTALIEVDGVKDVKVDLRGKFAAVELAGNIENSRLKEAIEEAGYDVTKIE